MSFCVLGKIIKVKRRMNIDFLVSALMLILIANTYQKQLLSILLPKKSLLKDKIFQIEFSKNIFLIQYSVITTKRKY